MVSKVSINYRLVLRVIDNYRLVPRIAINYSLVAKVLIICNLVQELSNFDCLVLEFFDFDNLALSEVSRHSGFICGVGFWIFFFYLGKVRWQRIVWELWSCFQRWITPFENQGWRISYSVRICMTLWRIKETTYSEEGRGMEEDE